MRKLATAAAVSLALASGGAKALILGEIEMRSALNQPMNAEISLSSIAEGELDGMIVTLASQEAFARAGIERTQVLTDLRFSVTQGANGQPVILVSSVKPVLEPFLNFLLEVEWTRGRMVREYTVLLDPPVFMTANATPRNASADTPAVLETPDQGSLLTPTPIDRSDAPTFDEASVTVVDDVGEISDDTVLAAATEDAAGEVVDLGEVVELGDVEELGEVVDLSDAATTAGDVSGEAFDPGELAEVVELGDLLEVDDSLGAAAGNTVGQVLPAPGTEIDSEIVTLSDPEVANPQTVTFADESSFNAETGWEVQVMGDTTEVPDSAGIEVAAVDTIDLGSVDVSVESEVVSLDEVPDAQVAESSSEVVVARNDTLFEIARDNGIEGLSTQQMMLALLEANQQAFINGNINLVKAGAILRIPDSTAVNSMTQAEALAQVDTQEQLWREYRDNLRETRATAVASTTQTDSATGTSINADAGADSSAQSDAGTDIAATDTAGDAGTGTAAEEKTNDLTIVADNQSTSTVASTNAIETGAPDTDRLGGVNQELQLAREELAALRLESNELAEQDAELKDVTDNMDQLVSVQQDQLAKLEAQLADARNAAESAAVSAQNASTDAAADAVADSTNALEAGTNAVGDTVTAAADTASDAAAGAIDNASNIVADAGSTATDAVSQVTGDATDAASGALESVADASSASADALKTGVDNVTPPASSAWYEGLVSNKAIAGGFGALAVGALGWTLLRRRKRDEFKDEDLDQVEFVQDNQDSAFKERATAAPDFSADADEAATENIPSGAVVGGAAASLDHDQTVNLDNLEDSGLDDSIAKDDTISEAEVYLAYGLHGQAEDLLKKAIERKPDHPEYKIKLLQTYHAQGNASAFDETATAYHAQFGGDGSQDWGTIAEMGQSLNPANELYAGAGGSISSLGVGNYDGPKLDADDFSAGDADPRNTISSQVRDFSSSDAEAVDMVEDESPLMEKSLDPAFAIDESDLEATGDFSRMSKELEAEIPPEDDQQSSKIAGAAGAVAAAAAGAVGLAGAADSSKDDGAKDDGILEFDAPDLGTADTSSVDTLSAGPTSSDLTMDLDQLTGELDLDSTGLLTEDMVQDLEIPDLTSSTDLSADASAAFGSVDEMDTMMDLAKAYIDMGDKDSASSALDEIVKSGSPEQKTEAENLLRKIS